MAHPILNLPPTRLRALPARGIVPAADQNPIDRDGGDYGAGLLLGVAVVSRGEAVGHGEWIDGEFLGQTAQAINASPAGTKSRFTHPELSADGMGKQLGRIKNGRVDGDVVRADLHVLPAAHEAPDGDLAGYVMDLGEQDPAAFGTSIVYEPDRKAETEFAMNHGAVIGENGYYDDSDFQSPDPLNTANLPHVRLAKLFADDVVDEPAANPAGLFHRQGDLLAEADALLSYSLGLSGDRPTIAALGADPDRVAGFVARFLDSHNLTVTKKEAPMPATAQSAGSAPEETSPKAVPESGEPKPEEEPKKPEAQPGEATAQSEHGYSDARADIKRYLDVFGPDGGSWFAEGLSYEAATDRHIARLKAERDEARQKLASVNRGEAQPARFEAGDKDPRRPAADGRLAFLPESIARYAASLTMPGKK